MWVVSGQLTMLEVFVMSWPKIEMIIMNEMILSYAAKHYC